MKSFIQFLVESATGYSENLIKFLKAKEGFYKDAYWDYKQWTVGYGTKARSADETITEEEADRRLREETNQAAGQVAEMLSSRGINLTDPQREALISFTINGGPGMTQELLDSEGGRKDWETISSAMRLYNKAGGETVQGLANRREAEILYANSNGTQGYDHVEGQAVASNQPGEEKGKEQETAYGQEDFGSMTGVLAALMGAANVFNQYGTTGQEEEAAKQASPEADSQEAPKET